MNVKQFLVANDEAGKHDNRLHVDLVRFGDNDTDTNYLRLIEHSDGRLDLVDCNCGDTGTGIDPNLPATELIASVREWIDCVYSADERERDREASIIEDDDEYDPGCDYHSFVEDAIPDDLKA